MTRILPGYRGPKRGTDAVIASRESRALRGGLVPDYNAWGLSVETHSPGSGALTTLALTANTVHLTPIIMPPLAVRLKTAAYFCSAVNTVLWGEVALYSYDRMTNEPFLKLVPATAIRIPAVAATLVTKDYPEAVEINPRVVGETQLMFVAIRRGSVGVSLTVGAKSTTNSSMRLNRTYAHTATLALPDNIVLDSTTVAVANVPCASFLSETIGDIL